MGADAIVAPLFVSKQSKSFGREIAACSLLMGFSSISPGEHESSFIFFYPVVKDGQRVPETLRDRSCRL